MTTAIWWVRRDLRLNDNDALARRVGARRPRYARFRVGPRLACSARYRARNAWHSCSAASVRWMLICAPAAAA